MLNFNTKLIARVHCFDFAKATIHPSPTTIVADKNAAHIWMINSNDFKEEIVNEFCKQLSNNEKYRAGKFYFKEDRTRYILAYYYLKKTIAKYLNLPFWRVVIKRELYKKPWLVFNPLGINFNLSHTGNRIVIAFRFDGLKLGIDIEKGKLNFDYNSIVRDYFTIEEETAIHNSPSDDLFFKLWTRKEALLKATGSGLIDSMRSLNLINKENHFEITDKQLLPLSKPHYISSFKTKDDYFISLALESNNLPITFYEIDANV